MSIFAKHCPSCTASHPLEATRCGCGYSFTQEKSESHTQELEGIYQEEKLYHDYLAARADEAEKEAHATRSVAAHDPGNAAKAAAAKVAEETAQSLRAEVQAQVERARAVKNRIKVFRTKGRVGKPQVPVANTAAPAKPATPVRELVAPKKEPTVAAPAPKRADPPPRPAVHNAKSSLSAKPAAPAPKPPVSSHALHAPKVPAPEDRRAVAAPAPKRADPPLQPETNKAVSTKPATPAKPTAPVPAFVVSEKKHAVVAPAPKRADPPPQAVANKAKSAVSDKPVVSARKPPVLSDAAPASNVPVPKDKRAVANPAPRRAVPSPQPTANHAKSAASAEPVALAPEPPVLSDAVPAPEDKPVVATPPLVSKWRNPLPRLIAKFAKLWRNATRARVRDVTMDIEPTVVLEAVDADDSGSSHDTARPQEEVVPEPNATTATESAPSPKTEPVPEPRPSRTETSPSLVTSTNSSEPAPAFREAQSNKATLAAESSKPATQECPNCSAKVPINVARCKCGLEMQSHASELPSLAMSAEESAALLAALGSRHK